MFAAAAAVSSAFLEVRKCVCFFAFVGKRCLGTKFELDFRGSFLKDVIIVPSLWGQLGN